MARQAFERLTVELSLSIARGRDDEGRVLEAVIEFVSQAQKAETTTGTTWGAGSAHLGHGKCRSEAIMAFQASSA